MPTGCECHGASLRSTGNISRIYSSMKADPNNGPTTRLSTTSKHMRMHRSPIWRCSRITLFKLICCSLKLLRSRLFWRLMRNV